MKLNCYAVYDVKACVYNTPFFMLNHGVALRAFSDWSNDSQTVIARHPEDYSLWFLGEFDDATAHYEEGKPLNLGMASSFVKHERPMVQPLDAALLAKSQNGEVTTEVVS